MKTRTVVGRIIVAHAASLMFAAQADAAYVYVDTFTSPTQNVSLVSGPGSTFEYTNSTVAVGGEREILLSVTNAGSFTFARVAQTLPDGLAYETTGDSLGYVRAIYDGTDGSSNINFTGLGNFDLTGGGPNDRFQIRGGADNPGGEFIVTIYSSESDYSRQTLSIPGGTGTAGTFTNFFFAFADMTDFGAGADFKKVNAIVLEMNGLAQAGIEIGLNLFVAIPEPIAWWPLTGLAAVVLLRRRLARK